MGRVTVARRRVIAAAERSKGSRRLLQLGSSFGLRWGKGEARASTRSPLRYRKGSGQCHRHHHDHHGILVVPLTSNAGTEAGSHERGRANCLSRWR